MLLRLCWPVCWNVLVGRVANLCSNLLQGAMQQLLCHELPNTRSIQKE